jgi:tetratricopeptide (TPR) repeat protein
MRLAAAHKLGEAWRVHRSLPETPFVERVWKLVAAGAIHECAAAHEEAEQVLGHAASLALVAHLAGGDNADAGRLAAHVLHRLGILQRRRESWEEALQSHRLALLLRERCGSTEERWESQVELGVDCELSRDLTGAISWHAKAVETAAGLPDKQAVAWTHLAGAYGAADRHEEALDAARRAHELWTAFDPSAVAVPRAEARLGGALVALAAGLLDRDPPRARILLREALDRLCSARESLEAFGPQTRLQAAICDEQRDFAERLSASL